MRADAIVPSVVGHLDAAHSEEFRDLAWPDALILKPTEPVGLGLLERGVETHVRGHQLGEQLGEVAQFEQCGVRAQAARRVPAGRRRVSSGCSTRDFRSMICPSRERHLCRLGQTGRSGEIIAEPTAFGAR